MPAEFIGFVGQQNFSETVVAQGPAIDVPFIEAMAKAQEYGGFDRVLVAFHSHSPDSIQIAQHIASVTRNLNLMIAHRPGFTAPTILARQLATLDHLTQGRIGVHIITGAEDEELARDGDHLTKDERYARASEFLDIVRAEWASETPFDYEGKYYRVKGARSDVKPFLPSGIPVYFGGASAAALEVAGRHADVYALWGETHDQVRELISRVRQAAAPHGRQPRFSLSLRPIIAETEELAWAKADAILERARLLLDKTGFRTSRQPANEGAKRLLSLAAKGDRHDTRLWTALSGLVGAKGNTTSLVGTPDQVAEAMAEYYDLGISTFLVRGFEPLADAVSYGRDLLPRVRALIETRDRARQAAE